MKLAILSVTSGGALLASRLGEELEKSRPDIYAKVGRNPCGVKEFDSLADLTAAIFHKYDGLVFIMAAGIVVRVIAPQVGDKRSDPAVVVMDERGGHVISLLSGHLGRANDLTAVIAAAVGARPVITTASDVLGKSAADVLAVKLGLAIEPFARLTEVNAAIVNGDKVAFGLDYSLAERDRYRRQAAELGVALMDIAELLLHNDDYDAAVMITDKEIDMVKPHVFLRPASLAVGIGCRRGVAAGEILAAIEDACKRIGRSMKSVAGIASAGVKHDEAGILTVAGQLAVPVEFFTNQRLQECIDRYGLEASKFVESRIGVGNVCEAAALLGGKTDRLLLAKTKYDNITIAIAEARSR